MDLSNSEGTICVVGDDAHINVIKIMNYALMNRQGLTTPSLRATPPLEGNFSATETEAEKVSGLKFPSYGGVPEGWGGHPRRATKPYLNGIDAHRPLQVPPDLDRPDFRVK